MRSWVERCGKDLTATRFLSLATKAEFNLTLPEWTTEVYPDRLQELTALSFEINAMTREMQRLKGGELRRTGSM